MRVSRAVGAEGLGTLLLVAAVVGSGIMAERLAGGNVAIALLANTVATGAALLCLVLAFGPISGAHFNPAVTLAQAPEVPPAQKAAYIGAQVCGGLAGVAIAHLMFEQSALWTIGVQVRAGLAQGVSEFVAAYGLVLVIGLTARRAAEYTPFAVAAYITAAYWFTASTSFANPAVTIARAFTDTFAGIRPVDVPLFVAAQLAGAFTGAGTARWLARVPLTSDL